MAQNEQILWDVLQLLHGRSHGFEVQTKDQQPAAQMIEHAFPVGKLKGELALKYIPADIEDTIYFLKHRDYLKIHGLGLIVPEMMYSMTEKAVAVFEERQLPKEEQKAFEEALWNIKPSLYGMGPNLPEFKKRAKKLKKLLGWK